MSVTLYSKCELEMNCPKEIVVWNYFDHEHVVGTHYKYYSKARIMSEKDNWCMVERFYRLPIINFTTSSVGFMALLNPGHIKSYQFGKLGIILDQDIYLKDFGSADRCFVTSEYRLKIPFALGLQKILQPLWQKITEKWFINTWDEDAPMRLRRWKVWKLGFRDFVGIDYINKKTERPAQLEKRPYPIALPVPKSTAIVGENGFERPFERSVEVGYCE